MIAAFFGNLDAGFLETLNYEVDNFTHSESFSTGNSFNRLLVTLDRCVTTDVLLLLSGVVFTVQKVCLLFLKLGEHFFALISELNLVDVSFTFLMEHDNHTDNVKLLLVDSSLIEKSLFVKLKHFLLKFNFFILDFLASFIKFREPLSAFVLLLGLKLSLEFSKFDFLFFVHFFLRFVHPLFLLEFLFATTTVNFHDKFGSTVHSFETTATDIITLEASFSFFLLAFFLSSSLFLFLSQVSLDGDVFRVNLEDVIRVFEDMAGEFSIFVGLFTKVLKEFSNLSLGILNLENSLFFVTLKLLKFSIEVLLKLEYDLAY